LGGSLHFISELKGIIGCTAPEWIPLPENNQKKMKFLVGFGIKR